MNKKNIFIIIAVILSIIAIATIIYFNSKDKESEINNEEKEQAVLEQDGFSINIPDGWEEINGVQGVLAMISNVNEENEDVALQNMGFRTYFAIAYEDAKEIDLGTYASMIKQQVIDGQPDFKIISETEEKINQKDGYIIEGEIFKEGSEFKVFIVAIKGMGDNIWLITFNTALKNWEKYSSIFRETIESFNIKKEMIKETNQENSEVGITILEQGSGEEAKNGDIVIVDYVGTLENGTKFDSSIDRGEPFTFTLGAGQVIQGWDLGVKGMKIGEKRKLIIPSALAYGEQGAPGTIPANAILIFEVNLLGINE
jgi:hypothetical protein